MEKPIISQQLIALDLDLTDKNSVIEFISQLAFKHGYITNLEDFLRTVKAREEEASTAVGFDVAIPHGKSDKVLHPFIACGRVKTPFLWDGSEEVKLIFLIGVPKTEGMLHLKFISQLSKKLLDDDYRNTLSILDAAKQVEQQLNKIEI